MIMLDSRVDIAMAASPRAGGLRRRVALAAVSAFAALAALTVVYVGIRADLARDEIPDELSTMLLPPR